ncbi:MAG TPA: 4a-hydroxytetrahydrobiopterin dehydratase [Bryobacteraceae bacterium]|nr:4a-hydroxytetrahydrobiopterin dehydratase [Bryobacteraceae bacterium]
MKAGQLSEQEVLSALAGLPGWSLQEGKLHKEFTFPDFALAFGFIASAVPGIERRNHHPEWKNVYNRIIVDLVTHDAGGITAADVELAQALEDLAHRLQ